MAGDEQGLGAIHGEHAMFSPLSRALLMTTVLALLSLGCGGGSQPGKGQPGKADFALSVDEFTREFHRDENAAIRKYQGKVVELTGEVDRVGTQDAGASAVVLMEGAKKQASDILGLVVGINLRPEDVRTGLRLSRKQKVKVTAAYHRFSPGFTVSLVNGSLEELSKSEVVTVSAADLAREFAQDSKRAAGKYGPKGLIVTGEVEEVVVEKSPHIAKLKGDGATRVSVALNGAERLLQKGGTAALRCELDSLPFEKDEVRLNGGFVVEVK
jgi:hypothetical protein